ncbi:hypothetical protein EZV73_20645 [Acidaminobacter sp. JC074]|uniref:hypothetical protein n=1 Tax=Acidaminobacter sp. JC074 TaxID=2530199 RepID=UPI001F0F8A83|nr:hypothetical protein [Acidaminobacter sp. JC074]MCH4890000.1 hypothetical protein [Acidaminobacter sp. JC074]
MNRILIASPRLKNSTSYYLSSLLNLEAEYTYVKDMTFDTFSSGDTLIIACPVYVDSLPANLLVYLENLSDYLKDHPISLKLYALVTCGFPEGHQTQVSLSTIDLFCKKNQIDYMGGLGVGSGEFMRNSQSMPMQTPIKKPVADCLKALSMAISNQEAYETRITQAKMSKFLFKWMSTQHWYSLGKKNGLRKKDLKKAIE